MSDRRHKLVALAAELAADFATRAGEHDRANSFPVENVDKMKAAGYTALVIPEKHGGLGADLEDFALCQEQLAQGCAATTIAINMHLFGIGSMVERATGRPQEELFFERDRARPSNPRRRDRAASPRPAAIELYFATRARRDGESFVLNGRKTFTSLAPVIDLFMVMATIEDSHPARRRHLRGAGAVRPGLELIETWDAMGMRATASHDLLIKDVRVSAAAMAESRPIGPVNDQAISLFAWFGIPVAATYTGVAIAALKFAKEFAGRLKPLTQPRTIKYLPGIQFAIAEAEALIAQSRALYLGVAREYLGDRASFKGESGLARVVMPEYVATNNAIRAVDYCMEVVGAHGMLKKFPMERYYRDVRAGPNHPLSNARARELLGKVALGVGLAETPHW